MAVLLQYNSDPVLTLEHLQESTQLKPELLQQVLAVLIKAKLLVSGQNNPLLFFLDIHVHFSPFPSLLLSHLFPPQRLVMKELDQELK